MKITIADIEIAQSSPEKLAALSGSELEIEEGREWLNFNFDYSIPWPDGLSLPTGLKELYCEDLTSWPDGLALPPVLERLDLGGKSYYDRDEIEAVLARQEK